MTSFLVSRQQELESLPELATQLILTIDFSIVWADVLLPSAEAVALQLYEVLRAQETLTHIGNIVTLANLPPAPSPYLGPPMSPTTSTGRKTSYSGASGATTPKGPSNLQRMSFSAMLSQAEPRGPAAEGIRNMAVIKSYFGEKIEDLREKQHLDVLEENQVLSIIKLSVDGLDLRESMALEDVGMR